MKWPGCGILLGWAAFFCGAGARTALARVPDGDVRKITAAVPKRATVRPKRPRRLLVFNLCKGFRHRSIPWGAKAIELIGQKTGAFETVMSTDVSVFEPASLRRFDAICMNNTSGQLFRDERLKSSLLDFVKSGKGIVGIHAATDCFKKWRPYGEMMGGYFDGHPWGAGDTVTIRIDEPDHPLCAAFEGKGFEIKEEMYQFKDPYSRNMLRVIMTIDLDKTRKKGGKRKDNDYAVSWVRSYGKGRVFFCSLGHNNHIFWHPAILRHYLDGIQFALGDLQADTTPSAAAVAPVDPFMGEYKGTVKTFGREKDIFAQVLGYAGGNYQANILESFDDPTKHLAQLKGRMVGEKVTFTGAAMEGGSFTGRIRAGAFEMKRIFRRSPTEAEPPPAGAVVLLEYTPGKPPSLDAWTNQSWKACDDGSMEVGRRDNITRQEFGDARYHIEFKLPYVPEKRGQGRGNSGVYVQHRYEVQVLDSFGLKSKSNDCGGIYGVAAPKVNACFPPGQWQTYDITFRAPRMSPGGQVQQLPRMTVLHNGVKIHDGQEVPKATTAAGRGGHAKVGPLKFQDHGHKVRYRNIWLVESRD